MRTTINLETDVVAAVEQLRRTTGLGISEAVNLLARQGLTVRNSSATPSRFIQRTHPSGFRVNIDNTSEVLELLDAEDA